MNKQAKREVIGFVGILMVAALIVTAIITLDKPQVYEVGQCIVRVDTVLKVSYVWEHGYELTDYEGGKLYRGKQLVRREYRQVDCIAEIYPNKEA